MALQGVGDGNRHLRVYFQEELPPLRQVVFHQLLLFRLERRVRTGNDQHRYVAGESAGDGCQVDGLHLVVVPAERPGDVGVPFVIEGFGVVLLVPGGEIDHQRLLSGHFDQRPGDVLFVEAVSLLGSIPLFEEKHAVARDVVLPGEPGICIRVDEFVLDLPVAPVDVFVQQVSYLILPGIVSREEPNDLHRLFQVLDDLDRLLGKRVVLVLGQVEPFVVPDPQDVDEEQYAKERDAQDHRVAAVFRLATREHPAHLVRPEQRVGKDQDHACAQERQRQPVRTFLQRVDDESPQKEQYSKPRNPRSGFSRDIAHHRHLLL